MSWHESRTGGRPPVHPEPGAALPLVLSLPDRAATCMPPLLPPLPGRDALPVQQIPAPLMAAHTAPLMAAHPAPLMAARAAPPIAAAQNMPSQAHMSQQTSVPSNLAPFMAAGSGMCSDWSQIPPGEPGRAALPVPAEPGRGALPVPDEPGRGALPVPPLPGRADLPVPQLPGGAVHPAGAPPGTGGHHPVLVTLGVNPAVITWQQPRPCPPAWLRCSSTELRGSTQKGGAHVPVDWQC